MGLALLVRHGQASFGAEDYDVLSDVGVAQSRRLGEWLAASGVEPAVVLHGAMRRQRDTATAMIDAAGWSLAPELDEGWDEFDHIGVISRSPELVAELTDRRAFQRAFVEATARWSGGQYDDEYDETWTAFVARGRSALDRASPREGVTVVVASGGPIAVACATLVDPDASADELPRLWNSFNTVSANTGISRVLNGSTGRRLLTFNEHSHLDRGLITYR
jgi:broad specificity phosphatase PhoE